MLQVRKKGLGVTTRLWDRREAAMLAASILPFRRLVNSPPTSLNLPE